MDLTIVRRRALDGVNPAHWDALEHGPSPFLEYGFLRALELSGSVGADAGWDPYYLLAVRPGEGSAQGDLQEGGLGGSLVGAIACFVKDHSFGEYIFDFQWARASHGAGLAYYPKLVIAAPFTPATGQRILLAPGLDEAEREQVTRELLDEVHAVAAERDCGSIHFLFTTAEERATLEAYGFFPRASFQYHFENREYESFDAFLARMTSRKRKQIRKERRRVHEVIDGARFIPGSELGDLQLRNLARFYRSTTDAHGGHAYLQSGFFRHLVELAPDRVQFLEIEKDGHPIAGALFLESADALYGRYWGCDEQVDFLHFEAACYQGIERCIQRGIPLFEAGAQGEHKLVRGFMPRETYSAHWIRHPELRRAIRAYTQEEARVIEQRMRAFAEYGPFKQDAG
jgi:predicted N-acyltransferase